MPAKGNARRHVFSQGCRRVGRKRTVGPLRSWVADSGLSKNSELTKPCAVVMGLTNRLSSIGAQNAADLPLHIGASGAKGKVDPEIFSRPNSTK